MTTITKERIELFIKNPLENGLTRGEQMELARIALASLEVEKCAEPVAFINGAWTLVYYRPPKELGLKIGDKLYTTAQPVPVDKEFIPKNLDKALGVVGVALPESKEEFNFQIERWIQRLIDRVIRYADEFKEQPAPVVPDEMATSDDMNLYQKSFAQGYNACRAAMLQGAEAVSNRDELPLDYLQGHKDGLEWAAQLAEANHPQTGDWLYDDPIELARAIRKGPDMPTVQAGNSQVIPDGYALVPVEPTDEMIAAAMNCDDVVFDSQDPTAFRVQFREIYCSMLAAAPKPETGHV